MMRGSAEQCVQNGIKMSCKHKWDVYLNNHSSNSQIMKIHSRKYCKVLTEVSK
jgi:hypothetical protein